MQVWCKFFSLWNSFPLKVIYSLLLVIYRINPYPSHNTVEHTMKYCLKTQTATEESRSSFPDTQAHNNTTCLASPGLKSDYTNRWGSMQVLAFTLVISYRRMFFKQTLRNCYLLCDLKTGVCVNQNGLWWLINQFNCKYVTMFKLCLMYSSTFCLMTSSVNKMDLLYHATLMCSAFLSVYVKHVIFRSS